MSLFDDIGSLLPGIGSLLDSFGGNSSTDLANQQLANQQQIQQFLQKLATATQVDARGNVTAYDPKTNTFKSTPSAGTNSLIHASDAEQLAQLTHDLPSQRQGRDVNAVSRSGENQLADTLMSRIKAYNPVTPERLEGDMATLGARGLKEGYNKVASDVSTQALRSGTGGEGLLDQLSRSYARDLGTNNTQAHLDSIMKAPAVNDANLNPLYNEYNLMRGRGANVGNVPFAPENISQGLDALLSGGTNRASTDTSGSANLANTGTANAISQNQNQDFGTGVNIQSLLKGIGGIMGSGTPSTPISGNASQASRNGF